MPKLLLGSNRTRLKKEPYAKSVRRFIRLTTNMNDQLNNSY